MTDVKIPVSYTGTLEDFILNKLSVKKDALKSFRILKKSLDARKKGSILWVYSFEIELINEEIILRKNIKNISRYAPNNYSFGITGLSSEHRPVVIGSGPSGMFCALMLARAGLKPIVAERGESVDEREKTIQSFWNGGELNSDSNVQFGEGGAGTFSDGKLTCGVNDKRTQFVLDEFAQKGAPEEIRYLAKPHIGTDYLKVAVKGIRNEIISLGGKFLFNTYLSDIKINENKIEKITLRNVKNGEEINLECKILVLAIGHSSRETYRMLYEKGLNMQKKPFSVGVRIEHKREYINLLQYKDLNAAHSLPAADYKLSCHPDGRGAYTFCMCPGGVVISGASENGQVVTNGMSYFSRDAENSNSAVLVSVLPEDIKGDSPLSSIEFQQKIENTAFRLGGGNFYAPCQKVSDFLKNIPSRKCGEVKPSYLPGVRYTDISVCFPDFVCDTLRKALMQFDVKMKGFCLGDALLTGVETRSSAPVRILRGDNMQSNISGIYPIGEGAGYAGGIMSSAIDGIKCAENIAGLLSAGYNYL